MRNKSRAFTLIELLVVVLIIGILAAVAVPQYQKAVDKAHFTQMITAARSIKNAQEVYYMANGTYTTDKDQLDVEISQDLGVTLQSCTAATPNAVYVRWSKLPGVLLISAYNKQCEANTSHMDGKSACYASDGNDRANSLCASWSGQTKRNQAGASGFYVYYF